MKTSQVLGIMKIVSWVIFIGICIKTGAIIISSTVSLFVNPEATKVLYSGLDLSDLYNFSTVHYLVFVSLAVILFALQAYIFLLVTKLFTQFDEHRPFSQNISLLINRISYFSLSTGLIALIGTGYSKWLSIQNIPLQFNWGAQEFLFMAAVIFVVALFFKRGIEIQAENDLTI